MFRTTLPPFLFLLAFGLFPCIAQAGDTIVVPAGMFQVDHELQLILVNLPVEAVNAQWPELKTVIQTDAFYDLTPGVQEITIGTDLSVEDTTGTVYRLYFTQLPLIAVSTNQAIVDEPRIPGNFMISDSTGQITSAGLGIEYRGAFSQNFPKKSYRVEFWNDTIGEETVDHSLLGMRSDDDWNLQAMYNEPLRARNMVCNKLWQMIHTPYYLPFQPDAVTGVAMEYVELFVNGAYQGIYGLSERVDRKQLKLKKYNGSIRGQLYKGKEWGGAVNFTSAPAYDNTIRTWSGYEYSYPKEVTDWGDLYDLVDFVVNAPDAQFLAENASRFEPTNAVDYYIFLNLLRATDNTGKNIHVALFDVGSPFFYVPYDFDGTFGMLYDGTQNNITDDLLSNGFYARLTNDCRPGGFLERLRTRWNELREDIITPGQIESMFVQEQSLLVRNGAYEREALKWTDYAHEPEDMDYLSTWLTARLAFLDSTFNIPCGATGVKEFDNTDFALYPNPASGQVQVALEGGSTPAELSLLDATGRTVLRQQIEGERTTVDLSSLRPGIYMVHLHRNGRTITSRLVII